jgi:lipoprotein-releasing system permease protein
MFEYFIAKKYLRTKHKVNFISVISIISTIGITVGVAALIIVISVFNGFGSLVKSILINFDPHVTITLQDDDQTIAEIGNYLKSQREIETYYRFVEGKVLLQNGRNYQVTTLKGFTEQNTDGEWGIKTSLLKGDINFNSESISENNILLSQRMAIRLSCSIGDTITISTFDNLQRMAIDFTAIPQLKSFEVSGIFATDNRDYDILYAFTSLKSAESILGNKSNRSGFECRMKDIDDSDILKSNILNKFKINVVNVKTWFDLHKDLYNVMQIERWAAFILLSLIISVATFNILGSLTMTVLEKKRDIGLLRSLGVKINSITKIFMFEGLLIGSIGTLAGLTIGLLVCYAQIIFKFYSLDPAKYIIDAIPVNVNITDILVITLASMLLTFLASLYPARRAAKTNLIDAIKYE